MRTSLLWAFLLSSHLCATRADDEFDELDELDDFEDGPLLFAIRPEKSETLELTEDVLGLVEDSAPLKSRSLPEKYLQWLTVNGIKGAMPHPETREPAIVEMSSELVSGVDVVVAFFYQEMDTSRNRFVKKSYADAASKLPGTFHSSSFHETLAQLCALENLHDYLVRVRKAVLSAPIINPTIKRKISALVNLVKTMQDASQVLGAKLTGDARIKRRAQADKDAYLARNSIYSMSLGFPYGNKTHPNSSCVCMCLRLRYLSSSACSNGQIFYLLESNNDPDALYTVFASLPDNVDNVPMSIVLHALVHGCQQFP